MSLGSFIARANKLLKTLRNPPLYITASLIVALGGLLNGLVFVSYYRPVLSLGISYPFG